MWDIKECKTLSPTYSMNNLAVDSNNIQIQPTKIAGVEIHRKIPLESQFSNGKNSKEILRKSVKKQLFRVPRLEKRNSGSKSRRKSENDSTSLKVMHLLNLIFEEDRKHLQEVKHQVDLYQKSIQANTQRIVNFAKQFLG